MSVANLTRYSVAPCYKDMSYTVDCVPDENGDYVKFEEAVEASSNSLQQLKAKIAAIADTIEECFQVDGNELGLIQANKLRQLSAI